MIPTLDRYADALYSYQFEMERAGSDSGYVPPDVRPRVGAPPPPWEQPSKPEEPIQPERAKR